MTSASVFDNLPVPCSMIILFLQPYDRTSFALCNQCCLEYFVHFLSSGTPFEQIENKSFALRSFLLNPIFVHQQQFYPLKYLHELKQVNAEIFPSSSPEFVGKLRQALYSQEPVTLKVLVEFGVNVNKIIPDLLLKKNTFQPRILSTVFSSTTFNINAPVYKQYPLVAAAIFLEKFEFWHVLNAFSDVDWTFIDSLGRNLAFWAVCSLTKNESLLFEFLKFCRVKKIKFDISDKLGNNCAMMAVKHQKLTVLQYLIEICKLDVNSANMNGTSLAHEASERGYPLILEYLITKNADMHLKNTIGDTPIDVVQFYHFKPCVNVLIKHNLWRKTRN